MNYQIAGIASVTGRAFSAGIVAAVIAVQVAVVWVIICGTSTASMGTLCLAAAAGMLLVALLPLRKPESSRWLQLLLTAFLAATAWGLSSAIDLSLTWSAGITTSSMLALTFAVPGCVVGFQSALLTAWLRAGRGGAESQAPFIAGIAFGLLIPLVHAFVVFPMAWDVSIALTMAVIARTFLPQFATATPDARDTMASESHWSTWVAAAATAIGLHSGFRIISTLMPVHVGIVQLAASLTMLVLLATLLKPFEGRRTAGFLLVVVVGLSAMPMLSDALIDLNLRMNATTESVFLMMLLRSVQLAGFWLLCLLAWRCTERSTAVISASVVACGSIALATGLLLASWGVSPKQELLLSVFLYLTPLVIEGFRQRSSERTRFTHPSLRVTLTVTAVAILMTTLTTMNGAATSQLLFNGRSAQGYRQGLARNLIEQSHCARLLEEHHSDGDPLTVWRTSGDQIMLRRNGFPAGQISSNSQTTPQPVADTLTTLLPLVMHRSAQSVLLLGDDSGVGLQVCCSFPLHTIQAVRKDAVTTDLAKRFTWTTLVTPPEDDDRVEIRYQDVGVAVRQQRAARDRFDVVVAASPNPLSAACQEQLSSQFYAAVRSQLTSDGVFCQRITQHDLGSQPLIRIVSAVRQVFGRVVVLQMVPGEIAVLAGVADNSLLDAGLLDRLQREHVARELTCSGWDWSQVAALPVVDANDPVGIFEHQEPLAVSSAANGYFAFAMPLETMRWGNKSGELQRTFAPHQQRMADAAVRSAAYPEFARRYSAVIQQAEIQTSFPDNPWPYRKSLKMEMQRNPRPPVESVQGGKVVRTVDPSDGYRKDYFVTLGQLLRQTAQGFADPLAMREFDRFTRQYEPLLSYFAHHELIRIHESTDHPSPAMELRSRLHTIYFSEGGDFSVRQITHAMNQILDDPELLAGDDARFDHLNSMLQELVRRWDIRRGYDPPSARRTQQDVDDCVQVANRALDAMEWWGPALNLSEHDLLARRRFVNQTLISPLRNYREQVLAHRIRHEAPAADTGVAQPDDLPLMPDPANLLTN